MLLAFPSELVVRILTFLSLSDLASCRCTCHLLHDLIETDVLLQYIIELRAAGVKNNPSSPSHLVLADRLRLLKESERAWEHLRFSRIVEVPLQHYPSSIYDLTGGLLLLGESHSRRFLTRRNTDAVRYLRLSHAIYGESDGESGDTTRRPWPQIDLQTRIIDVGLAVQEHDLIAVVAYKYESKTESHDPTAIEIHLLKLSTGKYHPAASEPVIHVTDLSFVPDHCSVSIEIVGNNLGILLDVRRFLDVPYSMVFNVFDWNSGRRKLFRNADQLYNSFCFLSSDVVVLPNLERNVLEICRLTVTGTSSEDQDAFPAPLETAYSLELPQLSPSSSLLRIWCRSEPNPTGREESTNDRVFHSDPADAIMIFNLYIQDGQHRLHTLSLLVHRSALLAYLPSHSAPQDSAAAVTEEHSGSSVSTILWNAWGPPVCRWFNTDDMATRWITTTCGQRYVTIGNGQPAHITVLDFNQVAIRRIMHERQHEMSTDNPNYPTLVYSDTMTLVYVGLHEDESKYDVFAEPVRSGLRYLATTTGQPYDYDGVLIDEGMLIGIKLDEFRDEIRRFNVHVIGPQADITSPPSALESKF